MLPDVFIKQTVPEQFTDTPCKTGTCTHDTKNY